MKKMRTESGNWINASYKSGMYEKWQKKAKINPNVTTNNDDDDDGDGDGEDKQKRNRSIKMSSRKKPKQQSNGDKRGPKRELKTKDEIFKQRKRLERIQTHQKKRQRQPVCVCNVHLHFFQIIPGFFSFFLLWSFFWSMFVHFISFNQSNQSKNIK